MPQFLPSVLISDAYGSVGDVTFYHRGGRCYYRKRTAGNYLGTAAQLSALDVHRRALAAWRTVDQSTQEIWNKLATQVEPHRPPFDHKAHITGQNLFVSAYHGFATLGNEHTPEPQPFEYFPPFAIQLQDAAKSAGRLIVPASVTIASGLDAGRYRLLVKVQLTEPGKGKHPGRMRNILADRNCDCSPVSLIINDYVGIWGLDLKEYQVYARPLLLDTVTGYRSQLQEYSTCLRATE